MNRTTLIVISACFFASNLMATPPKTETFLQELKECANQKSAFCRDLPIRISQRGASAIRPLENAIPTLPEHSQIMATSALILMENPQSTPALIRLVRTAPAHVRRLIVPALAHRTHRSVLSALLQCTEDKDEAVRALCAETVPKATPYRHRLKVTRTLIRVAQDWDLSVRIAAIGSLGQIGHPTAVPSLIAHVRKGNEIEQAAAIDALQFIPDARAINACLELMESAGPELTKQIGRTLNRITGIDFDDDYPLWQSWWANNKKSWKPPVRKTRKKQSR